MSLTYRIYPDLGLVYIRYDGAIVLSETIRVFEAYTRDPKFRPGQKQLVDLSRVTGYDPDYTRLLEVQARKVDAFAGSSQTMIVYFAPTAVGQTIAHLAARSWDDVGGVAAIVQTREEDALSVLGLTQASLHELLARSV